MAGLTQISVADMRRLMSSNPASLVSNSPEEAVQTSTSSDVEVCDHVEVPLAFSSALLHDLRQPIAAILLNAQAALRVVKRDPPPGQNILEDALHDIVQEVGRLKSLVSAFGGYLGTVRNGRGTVDVQEALSTALSLVAGELVRRQVHIQTTIPAEPPVVEIDSPRLIRSCIIILLDLFDALAGLPDACRMIQVRTETAPGSLRIIFQAEVTGALMRRSRRLNSKLVGSRGSFFLDSAAHDSILCGLEFKIL